MCFLQGSNGLLRMTLGFALCLAAGRAVGVGEVSAGEVVYVDIAGRPAERSMRIEAALDREYDWRFDEIELGAFIDRVAGDMGVPVSVDTSAIMEEGIATDTPITLKVGRLTGRRALELVLEPLTLAAIQRDGVLVVTTTTKADESFVTAWHPVDDLLPAIPSAESQQVFEAMCLYFTSGSWEVEDGTGGQVMFVSHAGSLVVRQTEAVHREISAHLTAVRLLRGLPARPRVMVVSEQPPPERRTLPTQAELDEAARVAAEQRRAARIAAGQDPDMPELRPCLTCLMWRQSQPAPKPPAAAWQLPQSYGRGDAPSPQNRKR